jgi:hypothetical protein
MALKPWHKIVTPREELREGESLMLLSLKFI